MVVKEEKHFCEVYNEVKVCQAAVKALRCGVMFHVIHGSGESNTD